MESIYPPERFKASENINLKEYFAKFSESISSNLLASSTALRESEMKESCKQLIENTNLEAIMGTYLVSSGIQSLEEDCSIDHLLCEGELKRRPIQKPQILSFRKMIFDGLPFTDQKTDLEVMKKKQEIEKIRSVEKLLALNKENFHNPVVKDDLESNLPKDLAPGCDFIINVLYYKPFNYNFVATNYAEKFRFCQEIQVLGSNTLVELRDTIVCASDSGIQAEVESPTADITHLLKAKEKYPSGSFFIDGVFYNDIRPPNPTDYSKEIIEWANFRKIGTFTTADMNSTKLSDLRPRFGYPYVYLHQGDCEHVMVFSDAHILTVNDCLNSQKYPRIYAINKSIAVMCYMCNLFASRWIIKDYSRLPQSTTFFCTKCTESYCYKDGEKIGEFQLYPVFDKIFNDECSSATE